MKSYKVVQNPIPNSTNIENLDHRVQYLNLHKNHVISTNFEIRTPQVTAILMILNIQMLLLLSNVNKPATNGPSRGGLEVEAWTDNSLHSALVGSNPI